MLHWQGKKYDSIRGVTVMRTPYEMEENAIRAAAATARKRGRRGCGENDGKPDEGGRALMCETDQ